MPRVQRLHTRSIDLPSVWSRFARAITHRSGITRSHQKRRRMVRMRFIRRCAYLFWVRHDRAMAMSCADCSNIGLATDKPPHSRSDFFNCNQCNDWCWNPHVSNWQTKLSGYPEMTETKPIACSCGGRLFWKSHRVQGWWSELINESGRTQETDLSKLMHMSDPKTVICAECKKRVPIGS